MSPPNPTEHSVPIWKRGDLAADLVMQSCLLVLSVLHTSCGVCLLFPYRLCMFILPLTLRKHHHLVLYDTVIALALILIDGAVTHLLKAAYIYPASSLYAH